jgi:phosphate-selective porin
VRGDVYNHDFERDDARSTFDLRRARLDWIIDVNEKYQLLIETDGADFNGPNSSDFNLVVAKISGPVYWGGRWTVGKFITPFSTENNRSSRSLDMIERHLSLNSLFLLPALDVQFGAMLKQPLSEDWTLYTGLFNGNGRAADNLSDNNGDKEFQAKLRHDYSDQFTWSISFDRSNEESQTLSLEGYSFTNYSAVSVEGTRRIYGGSFDYTEDPFSLRGEGLYANFTDADASLSGGYLQPAYFHWGDRNGGLQYLLRLDRASIDKDGVRLDGDTIRAATLGVNWYINGNVRLKVNGILEDYDGQGNNVSSTSGVQGDGSKVYGLTELQFKF